MSAVDAEATAVRRRLLIGAAVFGLCVRIRHYVIYGG